MTIIDVCDAVALELNGHQFTLPFTASREWTPEVTLGDNDVHVFVCPLRADPDDLDRTRSDWAGRVTIGIVKKLPGPDDSDIAAQCDAMCAVVCGVAQFLRENILQSADHLAKFKPRAVEIPCIYDGTRLREQREYFGVVEAAYLFGGE